MGSFSFLFSIARSASVGAQTLRAKIARLHEELAGRAVVRLQVPQAEESARALEAKRDKARAEHVVVRTVARKGRRDAVGGGISGQCCG